LRWRGARVRTKEGDAGRRGIGRSRQPATAQCVAGEVGRGAGQCVAACAAYLRAHESAKAVQRLCAVCDRPLGSTNRRGRFCSATCRKRASRQPIGA
jgi:hypothetical protein